MIIYAEEDFAEAAMRLTAGRGVDVVYDAVGKSTFEGSVRALAPRGHLVSFGQASGDVGSYSIDSLAARSVTLSRPNYGHYTDTPDKLKTQTNRLFAALRAGIIVAERPTIYGLADARAAHTDLENRNTMGSLVLIPQWRRIDSRDLLRFRDECPMPAMAKRCDRSPRASRDSGIRAPRFASMA
jgi:NADPH:quinone reductase-like Zn-dependent oxidoreductase